MIWFEQTYDKGPTSIVVVGLYNPPDLQNPKNLIEIIMRIENDERVVYSHNPSSLSREEPSEDEVAQKYFPKLKKVIEKVQNTPLDQLRHWKA